MRHRVKVRKLGRTASHRIATLKALATSLLRHKKIKTTLAKAKSTRSFVEPLITKAMNDSVHNRRYISKFVNDRKIVQELFSDIVSKIGSRPGGYTRIVKLGRRLGDAAEMAIIELVDYNALLSKKEKKTEAEKTKQKKIKSAKKTEAEAVETAGAETKVDAKAKKEAVEAQVVEESKAKKTEGKKAPTKKTAAKKTSETKSTSKFKKETTSTKAKTVTKKSSISKKKGE